MDQTPPVMVIYQQNHILYLDLLKKCNPLPRVKFYCTDRLLFTCLLLLICLLQHVLIIDCCVECRR